MSYLPWPDKVLEPTVAAYLAGLIDGEGTVGLWRQHSKSHTRKSPNFRPIVEISNTHLGVLEWVETQVGAGWLKCTNPGAAERYGHKLLYRFRFRTREVRWFLPQIRPYMIIKAAQADLLLEYFEKVGSTRPQIESRDELETLAASIRTLNQRGVTSGSS